VVQWIISLTWLDVFGLGLGWGRVVLGLGCVAEAGPEPEADAAAQRRAEDEQDHQAGLLQCENIPLRKFLVPSSGLYRNVVSCGLG